jgi:hypothetical protein
VRASGAGAGVTQCKASRGQLNLIRLRVLPYLARNQSTLLVLSAAMSMATVPEMLHVATLSFDAQTIAGYVLQGSSSVSESAGAFEL